MSFIRKYRKGDRTYLAEVESKRIDGKVVQRFIRYVGKQADGRTVLSTSISDAQVEGVKLYGPLLLLHHLAEEVGLREHLGTYAGEILSMVYAHCLDYQSVSHMQKWFQRTDLNWLLGLEQLTESRLLGGMDFHSSQEATLRQLLQAQQPIEVRWLKPLLHVAHALVVQAMGIHHAEDFACVRSQVF